MVAQEFYSNSRTAVEHALERPAEITREYPLSSMLVLFGLGVGVGVALSQVVCSAWSGALVHEPTFAERISRQVSAAVNDVLPDAISWQFGRFQS